jgi:hypothetical protein
VTTHSVLTGAKDLERESTRTFRRPGICLTTRQTGIESIGSENPWSADTESNNVFLPDSSVVLSVAKTIDRDSRQRLK